MKSTTVTDTTRGDFNRTFSRGDGSELIESREAERGGEGGGREGGLKINAITARGMTSVTSVNPVESRVEIARREIDWRTQRIRYRDVSKGKLASAGGFSFSFFFFSPRWVAALTSHCEFAVELGVHLFVSLVAPHFIHSLPHHRHGHHEALDGEKNESITWSKPEVNVQLVEIDHKLQFQD